MILALFGRKITVQKVLVFTCFAGAALLFADLTGLHRHIFEKEFEKNFFDSYPEVVEDFPSLIRRFREQKLKENDPRPSYWDLNLTAVPSDCDLSTTRLILLVKSVPENFLRRKVIRETWGFQKRFVDVPIKTVFLVGQPVVSQELEHGPNSQIQNSLNEEISKFHDILQGNFEDMDSEAWQDAATTNTTRKTFMGVQWVVERCSDFRYVAIVTDQIYLSVKNLLKFVRHPAAYPNYWEEQRERDRKRILSKSYSIVKKVHRTLRHAKISHYHEVGNRVALKEAKGQIDEKFDPGTSGNLMHLQRDQPLVEQVMDEDNSVASPSAKVVNVGWHRSRNSPVDFDIDLSKDSILYAGHVISGSTQRHKIGAKHYLTLEEYVYNIVPPFVAGSTIVLSKAALMQLYKGSLFTHFLRHDDLYLGLCAKKLAIEPLHSDYMLNELSTTAKFQALFQGEKGNNWSSKEEIFLPNYVISATGFENPEKLKKFWLHQKSLGHA